MSFTLKPWRTAHIDGVGVAVLAVLSTIGYVACVQPLVVASEQSTAENGRLAGEQQTRMALDATHERLASELGRVMEESHKSEVHLRDRASLNDLLRRIADTADASGFAMSAVQPGETNEESHFGVVKISVAGESTFSKAATFLHLISERFSDVAVRSFSLRATSETDGESVFAVELRWFVLPSAQLHTAAAGTPGTRAD